MRDNSIATLKEEIVQRKPYFAIVDEIDSILIDEARTPLIISGPAKESKQMYDELKSNVSLIVKNQKDLCLRLSLEAKKILDEIEIIKDELLQKLSKVNEEKASDAFQKLWLVSKGTPRNKILKRFLEHPDLRDRLDKLETYYHMDQNKKEKSNILSELFIIIDERASEFELTDKGINAWAKLTNDSESQNDFIMLDLGYEYLKIDDDKTFSAKEKIEKKLSLKDQDLKRKERSHNLRQLFRAHLLMEKDVDYIVQNNEIIIIDENTGRPQPGRRFSDGLHQAIEAKENVKVQKESQTYATITLQNYFRMYEKLSGMTGTAITEAFEFKQIYNLDVIVIPTYCPCQRKDSNDEIYMTEREKYNAILKEVKILHALKRPILIGTESVEISEKLSRIFKQNNLVHNVLNAKNHEREAEIISNAGQLAAITIATNMAGRGTDIKLTKETKEAGGLHVMGTTRHHSRRIDRQLRGRSGRLGDPGSSKFYVSFEDSLMRLFASNRLTSLLQRFRPPEGEPISAGVLNKSIETAQKRVEQRNFTMRKYTLEYDDVMNKQRQEIYSFRNDILSSDNSIEIAKDVIESTLVQKISTFYESRNVNIHLLKEFLTQNFFITFNENDFKSLKMEEVQNESIEKVFNLFEEKLKIQKNIIHNIKKDLFEDENDIIKNVLKNIMISIIDKHWQEHLLNIDHLRTDVNLRAVGQKDPLIEFKNEAFSLFEKFSNILQMHIATDLFKFEMVVPKKSLQESLKNLNLNSDTPFSYDENTKPKEELLMPITNENKVQRNESCPCGSGKKYKKCCGAID